jgi:hypothetical protein
MQILRGGVAKCEFPIIGWRLHIHVHCIVRLLFDENENYKWTIILNLLMVNLISGLWRINM